ncbi:dTDP-4-dehydrorhamnose reductase [Pontimonas sp.]|nr:dTDP-4-dehydrorhamnose reductase [Pontimonas sp.]
MTRIAVVGAHGMLGRDLVERLAKEHDVVGLSRSQLDITDAHAVNAVITGFDVVVNAAAYTAVDDAETHSEEAFAINAHGAQNLAIRCRIVNTRLIHVSTDYVFDGTASFPYTEDAPTNPQSVYGASKRAGEEAVIAENPNSSLIVRTSWLYGLHGTSFPRSILEAGLTRDYVDVVNDQWGQPTWTVDVAEMIAQLVEAEIGAGIFHATNAGATTWHAFATALFDLAGWDTARVRETTSAAFTRPAARPAWSVLGHDGWTDRGLTAPRPWEEALTEAWAAGLSQFAFPKQSA